MTLELDDRKVVVTGEKRELDRTSVERGGGWRRRRYNLGARMEG